MYFDLPKIYFLEKSAMFHSFDAEVAEKFLNVIYYLLTYNTKAIFCTAIRLDTDTT